MTQIASLTDGEIISLVNSVFLDAGQEDDRVYTRKDNDMFYLQFARSVEKAVLEKLEKLEADRRDAGLEMAALECERLRSSGENNDKWTITRDRAFAECRDAIRVLKSDSAIAVSQRG